MACSSAAAGKALGPAPGTQGADLDVEAAITSFVADPTRTSLEFPCMNAAQRKQAKKLADQHPELKCESYGFGAERQLHLFKRPGAADAGAVSVKNTFIDDWVAAEGSEGAAEPVVFRSMPPGLASRGLQPAAGEAAAPAKDRWAWPQQPRAFDASPACSTATSLVASSSPPSVASGSSLNSPASSFREPPALPELPSLPEGLEVRNTFIHFEEAPADQRSVQSMPHGMFRQCLQEEAARQAEASAQAAVAAQAAMAEAVATAALDGPDHLCPGAEVVIQGLTRFPAFNGLRGVVKSVDEANGRYNVLLLSPVGPGGHQWAKVKAENLRPAPTSPPPPPCYAPTILGGF